MRIIVFCFIVFFVANSIYSQEKIPFIIDINNTSDIVDLHSKRDSIISISVLKVLDRSIDSILDKTTSYLKKYEFKCIDIALSQCKEDSAAILRIVGNVPEKWIGYKTSLIGCVKKNGYLIFVYDNCNLNFNLLFSKTNEKQQLNKTAKVEDMIINMPTWFYSFSNKRILLLQAP